MCWLCRVRSAQFAGMRDDGDDNVDDEAAIGEGTSEAASGDAAPPAGDAAEAQPTTAGDTP